MQPKEMADCLKLIAALAASYGRDVDQALLMGYEIGLEDCDPARVKSAIRAAIKEKTQFMPTPGTLRAAALGGAAALDADGRALLAWSEVRRHMADAYSGVTFSDPVIAATIRTLHGVDDGWEKLTEILPSQLHWEQKRFVQTYKALAAGGFDPKMGAPFLGLFEKADAESGFTAAKQKMLGPPQESAAIGVKLKSAEFVESHTARPKLTYVPPGEEPKEGEVSKQVAEKERQLAALRRKSAGAGGSTAARAVDLGVDP